MILATICGPAWIVHHSHGVVPEICGSAADIMVIASRLPFLAQPAILGVVLIDHKHTSKTRYACLDMRWLELQSLAKLSSSIACHSRGASPICSMHFSNRLVFERTSGHAGHSIATSVACSRRSSRRMNDEMWMVRTTMIPKTRPCAVLWVKVPSLSPR
jgi:hypothetical protein